MEEQQTGIPPEPAQPRPLPNWLKYGLLALLIILLFGLQSFASNYSQELVRRETFAKGIDSLSAACVPIMLENNPSRMRNFIDRIAQQGGLSLVMLLDRDLKILASTDSQGELIAAEIKSSPLKTYVQRKGDRLRATRAVVSAGDTVVGTLVVEWVP
jgi:hypothetical protein